MKAAMAQGESKGIGLVYEECGTGFPVVFIHGLTFNRSTWRPILDRLAGRFRCVAVDLPGHGGSARLLIAWMRLDVRYTGSSATSASNSRLSWVTHWAAS
jgi:pimeloyl-ACP methyl ester carboxylesterase